MSRDTYQTHLYMQPLRSHVGKHFYTPAPERKPKTKFKAWLQKVFA